MPAWDPFCRRPAALSSVCGDDPPRERSGSAETDVGEDAITRVAEAVGLGDGALRAGRWNGVAGVLAGAARDGVTLDVRRTIDVRRARGSDATRVGAARRRGAYRRSTLGADSRTRPARDEPAGHRDLRQTAGIERHTVVKEVVHTIRADARVAARATSIVVDGHAVGIGAHAGGLGQSLAGNRAAPCARRARRAAGDGGGARGSAGRPARGAGRAAARACCPARFDDRRASARREQHEHKGPSAIAEESRHGLRLPWSSAGRGAQVASARKRSAASASSARSTHSPAVWASAMRPGP